MSLIGAAAASGVALAPYDNTNTIIQAQAKEVAPPLKAFTGYAGIPQTNLLGGLRAAAPLGGYGGYAGYGAPKLNYGLGQLGIAKSPVVATTLNAYDRGNKNVYHQRKFFLRIKIFF